jgi:hypothetical protein
MPRVSGTTHLNASGLELITKAGKKPTHITMHEQGLHGIAHTGTLDFG